MPTGDPTPTTRSTTIDRYGDDDRARLSTRSAYDDRDYGDLGDEEALTAELPYVEPPEFVTDLDKLAWRKTRENEAKQRARAFRDHPPGSILFVSTARGIPQRMRAGIPFSAGGRVKVEVTDMPEAKRAEAVRGGRTLVSPMGAQAIADDDGLQVFSVPAPEKSDPSASDERDRLADENRDLRERLARAEAASSSTSTARDGQLDTRSARTKGASTSPLTGKPAAPGVSDDFGAPADKPSKS